MEVERLDRAARPLPVATRRATLGGVLGAALAALSRNGGGV